jgi:hypothetical protein
MNRWDRREAHALIDALACVDWIDESTAARAHGLVDDGQVTDALELLRPIVARTSAAAL